jgi:hypothetical protein
VTHAGLDGPSVVAGIHQRIAAAMAEHVGMDQEGHPGVLTQARNQRFVSRRPMNCGGNCRRPLEHFNHLMQP